MPRKRHKPEEIVAKLRQVDVLVAQGRTVADAVRSIGATDRGDLSSLAPGVRRAQGRPGQAPEGARDRERPAAPGGRVADLTLDELILKEAAAGNYRAPRDGAPASSTFATSCRSPGAAPARPSALGSAAPKRSTQRKLPRGRDDEQRLTADIGELLARRYGRYGHRKVAELLRSTAGWVVDDKRVERSTAAPSMAARGAEGAREAAQARPALADGRLLRPAAGRAS
jgi:putative transposase